MRLSFRNKGNPYVKIRFFLLFCFFHAGITETNSKSLSDSRKRCNVFENITAYSDSQCYSGSYKYYDKSNNNTFSIEECCFLKSNVSEYGICEIGVLSENGTIHVNNSVSYEKVCVPYNMTDEENRNLIQYNSLLVPCAVDYDIKSSSDCFSFSTNDEYCCHVYGYISGVSISQCYRFNRSLGRPGIFYTKELSFFCWEGYFSIGIYFGLLVYMIIMIDFMCF